MESTRQYHFEGDTLVDPDGAIVGHRVAGGDRAYLPEAQSTDDILRKLNAHEKLVGSVGRLHSLLRARVGDNPASILDQATLNEAKSLLKGATGWESEIELPARDLVRDELVAAMEGLLEEHEWFWRAFENEHRVVPETEKPDTDVSERAIAALAAAKGPTNGSD